MVNNGFLFFQRMVLLLFLLLLVGAAARMFQAIQNTVYTMHLLKIKSSSSMFFNFSKQCRKGTTFLCSKYIYRL